MKSKCIVTTKNEHRQCTFIILCSQKSNKRGYRNIPLTPIDSDDLLIDKQIKTIQSLNKNSEIILISGFEHEKLLNHIRQKRYKNIRIAENKDYKNSSALDCWIFALNLALDRDTFIIHGDRLFSESCINIKQQTKTHIIYNAFDRNNYNLGVLFAESELLNISYGLFHVWSEIFFISKEDFNAVRNMINENKQYKFYNIEGFINLLNQQLPIQVIEKDTKDILTLKELR